MAGEPYLQRSEEGRNYIFEELKEDLCSWSLAKEDRDGAGEVGETPSCRILGAVFRIWALCGGRWEAMEGFQTWN